MITQSNKFIFAAMGFGFFVIIFAFLISVNPFFFIERLLKVDSTTTAVQSISTIRTLQGQYASKHQGKFAPNFDELIKSVQLDEKFKGESPVVSGYIYTMKVESPLLAQPAFYSINADPIYSEDSIENKNSHYYFDSNLKAIKVTDENRQANKTDPSL